MAFHRVFDEETRTVCDAWEDESQPRQSEPACHMCHEASGNGIREAFDRIRRNRACYRCGASPEHCECPDEYEPDGAR